jgi:hypothetical protein
MSERLFDMATRLKEHILRAVQRMTGDEKIRLADRLVERHLGWVLAHNLDRFSGLPRRAAEGIIDDDPLLAATVMAHLDAFRLTDADLRILMYLCVDRGQPTAVATALRRLPLDAEFARYLIAHGQERIVGEHLALFKGYAETQFHADRRAWHESFDLRRAPGHRYKV